MSETKIESPEQRTERIKQARAAWLVRLRDTAREFVQGAPLSIPPADVARAIDRVVLAFRAMANTNPQLFDCTPISVSIALSKCALTGLMPGGANPEVDLIVRKGRKKQVGDDGVERWVDGPMELNWQIGFRGYLTLAARAGCHVKPVPVFIGDEFVHEEGMDAILRHVPLRNVPDRGFDQLECVYVVIKYADGHKDFRVVDRALIEARREVSEGWKTFKKGWIKSTPWQTNPIEMSMKTAIRYAAQRGDIALDDVARYAFEQDRDDEDTIDRNVVAVVQSASAGAPAPKAIAEQLDANSMDGLEADYSAPEKVRVDQPNESVKLEAKAQADRDLHDAAKAKKKAEDDAKFNATQAAEKAAKDAEKAAKKKAKDEADAKKKADAEAAAKAAPPAKVPDEVVLTSDEMVDLAEEIRMLEGRIGVPRMIIEREAAQIPVAASVGTLVKDAPRTALAYAKTLSLIDKHGQPAAEREPGEEG